MTILPSSRCTLTKSPLPIPRSTAYFFGKTTLKDCSPTIPWIFLYSVDFIIFINNNRRDYYERTNGGVRGLGVRGLGEKQDKERLMTKYRIVSFLDVSPFTYEQLRRVSSIQRNVLRKNLDLLVKEGTIFAHKYSIPYTQKFYGYMYKYPIPYMKPLYGCKYYLLDRSQRQADGYMNFYYNNKARESIELLKELLIKERQKHQQKLCKLEDETTSSRIKSKKEIKEMTKTELRDYWRKLIRAPSEMEIEEMTRTEARDNWQRIMELCICFERIMREKELIAVSVGVRFRFEQSVAERELNSAIKIAKFFIKKGYSLFDVLIRCCTERTTIFNTGYYSKNLDLHLIRYSLLWEIMEKAGLFKTIN
jgi:hypothetical protein